MQSLLHATKSPPAAGGGASARADECAREVLDAVPVVIRSIRKEMRGRRPQGLSVPQFRTLVMVNDVPDASVSCVADFLGASLPTASRIVGGLVARGMIARRSGAKDRRRVSLSLTPHGRTVQAAARAGTQGWMAGKVSGLADEERQTVTRAMKLLRGLFRPEPAGAGKGPTRRGKD